MKIDATNITMGLLTGISGGTASKDMKEFIRHTWAHNYAFTAFFITEN